MTKFLARAVLLGAVLSFATAVQAQFDVTAPGDVITGVDLDDPLGLGTWPGGEAPLNAINNVTQKYLNFGVGTAPNQEQNTGFIVTPSFGGGAPVPVIGLRFFTANDAPERDPASFTLAGALSPTGPFTDIPAATNVTLVLPTGRNAGGNNQLSAAASFTEVFFTNPTAYTSYRLVFPTVRSDTANSMQIAEVEFLAVPEPSTVVLAAVGLVGLVIAVRRRRK